VWWPAVRRGLSPRDPQRPTFVRLARLGDIHPPHCLRPIARSQQLGRQLIEKPVYATGFDIGESLPVHTGSALVSLHLRPGPRQVVLSEPLVVERREPPPSRSLDGQVQRSLQLSRRVSGATSRHRQSPTRTRSRAPARSRGPSLRPCCLARPSTVL